MGKRITLRVNEDLYNKIKASSMIIKKSMNQLMNETLKKETFDVDEEILHELIDLINDFRKRYSKV